MTKSLTLSLEDDGTYTLIVDECQSRYFDMLPHEVEIFLNDFREQCREREEQEYLSEIAVALMEGDHDD